MLDDPSHRPDTAASARQAALGVLARADRAALASLLDQAPALPGFTPLRGPEVGLVMARGRIGGGGGAFNLGEMTVARCSIRDEAGRVGHGYAAGRDLAKVTLIARLDAALQDPSLHAPFWRSVIEPLAAAEEQRRATLAAKAAATEVKFFTLATMRS